MTKLIKTDDVIFNFFKQICDEKDEVKCVELGNNWINAMQTNLNCTHEGNIYTYGVQRKIGLEKTVYIYGDG